MQVPILNVMKVTTVILAGLMAAAMVAAMLAAQQVVSYPQFRRERTPDEAHMSNMHLRYTAASFRLLFQCLALTTIAFD